MKRSKLLYILGVVGATGLGYGIYRYIKNQKKESNNFTDFGIQLIERKNVKDEKDEKQISENQDSEVKQDGIDFNSILNLSVEEKENLEKVIGEIISECLKTIMDEFNGEYKDFKLSEFLIINEENFKELCRGILKLSKFYAIKIVYNIFSKLVNHYFEENVDIAYDESFLEDFCENSLVDLADKLIAARYDNLSFDKDFNLQKPIWFEELMDYTITGETGFCFAFYDLSNCSSVLKDYCEKLQIEKSLSVWVAKTQISLMMGIIGALNAEQADFTVMFSQFLQVFLPLSKVYFYAYSLCNVDILPILPDYNKIEIINCNQCDTEIVNPQVDVVENENEDNEVEIHQQNSSSTDSVEQTNN
eukprot:TRINITY_DN504_c0_g1_i1.p1 TRINITY_DN504_c0_g1~~TRINITY_DN504_c0_g1_i1.p1  ORF type:complete len:361 (+),score=115.64 TRINITY_DN504_c0_g1_i1:51-1133(+)